VGAEDWPRWRGSDGLGVSAETNLPVDWTMQENVEWTTELPEWGNSSPVVIGDRIYLTTQTADTELHVLAIDRTSGRILWQQGVGKGSLKTHKLHNMATPSVVADSEHVWALFGTGDLACLGTDGTVIWKRQMQQEYGEYQIQWGMGSSLVLYEGNVIVVCMHRGPSYVLALDGRTGDPVWKQTRTFDALNEGNDAYTTPILINEPGGPQLVISGADHVTAYNPADGTEIWRSAGLKVDHPNGRSISSPTANENTIVVVASGFRHQGHTMALKRGGRGDITETHRRWIHEKNSPDCSTPVCYQGLVYLIDDGGKATCLDTVTGEVKWEEKLLSGDTKVSPVAGDGKVYFFNNEAVCKVVEAGPEGKVLAENHLEGTMLATPAISHGRLYVRTRNRLYAIRTAAPAEK
jgi:outer membrane protein assembly factor BamB